MDTLVNYIKSDLLAFIVLIILILCILATLIFSNKDRGFRKNRLYSILLLLFPFIGFPAALDLMTTVGYTKLFAVLIFIILLLPFIIALISLNKKQTFELLDYFWDWFMLPFIAGGLIVSGYLTYVELTSSTAVCGVAIPGCGEVQNSPYANLFGFLPVALLGVIGYLGILVTWFGKKIGPQSTKKIFNLSMWGLGFFGILFSVYLTYLEVFVLHATCTWCVLAAVFMMMLFWISIRDAQEYFFKELDDEDDPA